MAFTQPLLPPRTPLLRLLSPSATALDPASLPAFEPALIFASDDDLAPFSYDDLADYEVPIASAPLHADVDDAPGPAYVDQPEPEAAKPYHRQTGFLSGVSLSAVLQMLHLERTTCVVEVSARGWLGTLTLVNGELVDAGAGEMIGEEAACAILNWPRPQTTIIDGVELFRHTVERPITSLIMDAVRIGDESGMLDPSRVGGDFDDAPADDSGWQWLVDSLILTGATTARIVTAGPAEQRQTGFLVDPTVDLARGIRTWASLLGPDVTEVVVTRSDHIAILAMLDAAGTQLIYAEAPSPETAELVRRAVRSIKS